MTATPGFRRGRIRVLIVDDEPALTQVLSVAVTDAGRRPYPVPDHTVRGLGYAVRPAEDGR
ncbi:hypothetical protein [Streptomyces asoensis]|uniref:Response regulatory domain-containing protein n=1 Tax=Streptomyces asoensis TaxID=249586 RepID=A0ABQ3S9L4_9ACTN|nr:hypothetical protein [Streptomyces asoensis]GGQ70729.1 hypothetical protein GCM10010496_37450 [Streptomyces asoensis]GHI64821.1 hypothetical protein Saso_64710 [Streptomyces asoensis]